MNINLHIESLVLDGLPLEKRQTPRLRAAAEHELTRLLAESRLASPLTSGGAVTYVASPVIHLDRDHGSTELARQIAAAVYGGLAK